MSSYEEVVQKDLALLWAIQEYCRRTPWISSAMRSVVSKHPLRDIVSVLWAFFLYGVVELQFAHFWVVVSNLGAASVARTLLESRRPVEFDTRLQPLTDMGADSYGFPSLESYMSVVIIGHLLICYPTVVGLVGGLSTIFIIGFSRVFSRSRFPHQIVGSWLLGVLGLLISVDCCKRFNIDSLKLEEQGVLATLAVVAILCNLAYSMENNDSRLVYVPKREFVRVLSEIVSGPSSQQDPAIHEDSDSEDEGDGMGRGESNQARARNSTVETPHSSRATNQSNQVESQQLRRVNQAAHLLHSKKGYVKSDSLYFLQKSLELRESAYKERYRSGDHQLNTDQGP